MSMDELEKAMDTSGDIPGPGPIIAAAAKAKFGHSVPKDPWMHRSETMLCRTCIYYVPKNPTVLGADRQVGRCRRHAPVANVGYPVVYSTDWCGDHKLDKIDF